MMRSLLHFVFGTLSVLVTAFLLAAWLSWEMTDFDCGLSNWECRRGWLAEEGLVISIGVTLWLIVVALLYKTRNKK